MPKSEKDSNKILNRPWQRSRAAGTLLGHLCGDALGLQVVAHSPEVIRNQCPKGIRSMVGGGSFSTLKGQISNVSELALVLSRHLLANGRYDSELVFAEYRNWLDSVPFECGLTTANSLLGKISADSLAPGALARITPIGIAGAGMEFDRVAAYAIKDTSLTHPNPVCGQINALLAICIAHAVSSGATAENLFQEMQGFAARMEHDVKIRRLLDKIPKSYKPGALITETPDVLQTFEIAMKELLFAPSTEEGISHAIMFGGIRSRHNGALAGALLGAVYGLETLDSGWLDAVQSCQPKEGLANVFQPRPERYWAQGSVNIAHGLLGVSL